MCFLEALNLTGNITLCLCEWQLAVKHVVSIARFHMTHPNKIFILINPEQGQKESQDINLSASPSVTHRPTDLCTIPLNATN